MLDLANLPFPEVEVHPLEEATDAQWAAVAVPVAPGGEEGVEPRTGVADVAARYGIDVSDLADLTGVTGKAGEITTIALPRPLGAPAQWSGLPRRVVLVGIGDGSSADLRAAGAQLARAAAPWGSVLTTVPLLASAPLGEAAVREAQVAFVVGALLASYPSYSAKTSQPGPRLERLGLAVLEGTTPAQTQALATAVATAQVLAGGTAVARTLAATPADVATPAWLAEQATALVAQVRSGVDGGTDAAAATLAEATGQSAGARLDLTAQVHGEGWLAEHGFGGIVAVAAGSQNPPRLVTVTYDGRRGTRAEPVGPTIAIVGKGISYDTGGLALKPRESMALMKTDMTGSAVALATALAAARARLPLRVVAVMALAENAFSGSSYRPGDVVRVWDGTTVEIGNTDAEGRMVLADAMAWARQTWHPDFLVDVATLTGAAKLALGTGLGAVFTPEDALATALEQAGEATGERLWRLPLVADYRDALASEVADVNHIATDTNVKAGAVAAALFLERFAHDTPWAHLDIAGPARSGKARNELPEGATGFGVRLLVRWLSQLRWAR